MGARYGGRVDNQMISQRTTNTVVMVVSVFLGCSAQVGSRDVSADGAGDAALVDAGCVQYVFPDGTLPPPNFSPCVFVMLVSSSARCINIGDARVRLRSEDAGVSAELLAGPNRTSIPPSNVPVYSTGGSACSGWYTIDVEHPAYESLSVRRLPFRDRYWMGNGSTEIVVLELTPRGQVDGGITDASERD